MFITNIEQNKTLGISKKFYQNDNKSVKSVFNIRDCLPDYNAVKDNYKSVNTKASSNFQTQIRTQQFNQDKVNNKIYQSLQEQHKTKAYTTLNSQNSQQNIQFSSTNPLKQTQLLQSQQSPLLQQSQASPQNQKQQQQQLKKSNSVITDLKHSLLREDRNQNSEYLSFPNIIKKNNAELLDQDQGERRLTLTNIRQGASKSISMTEAEKIFNYKQQHQNLKNPIKTFENCQFGEDFNHETQSQFRNKSVTQGHFVIYFFFFREKQGDLSGNDFQGKKQIYNQTGGLSKFSQQKRFSQPINDMMINDDDDGHYLNHKSQFSETQSPSLKNDLLSSEQNNYEIDEDKIINLLNDENHNFDLQDFMEKSGKFHPQDVIQKPVNMERGNKYKEFNENNQLILKNYLGYLADRFNEPYFRAKMKKKQNEFANQKLQLLMNELKNANEYERSKQVRAKLKKNITKINILNKLTMKKKPLQLTPEEAHLKMTTLPEAKPSKMSNIPEIQTTNIQENKENIDNKFKKSQSPQKSEKNLQTKKPENINNNYNNKNNNNIKQNNQQQQQNIGNQISIKQQKSQVQQPVQQQYPILQVNKNISAPPVQITQNQQQQQQSQNQQQNSNSQQQKKKQSNNSNNIQQLNINSSNINNPNLLNPIQSQIQEKQNQNQQSQIIRKSNIVSNQQKKTNIFGKSAGNKIAKHFPGQKSLWQQNIHFIQDLCDNMNKLINIKGNLNHAGNKLKTINGFSDKIKHILFEGAQLFEFYNGPNIIGILDQNAPSDLKFKKKLQYFNKSLEEYLQQKNEDIEDDIKNGLVLETETIHHKCVHLLMKDQPKKRQLELIKLKQERDPKPNFHNYTKIANQLEKAETKLQLKFEKVSNMNRSDCSHIDRIMQVYQQI